MERVSGYLCDMAPGRPSAPRRLQPQLSWDKTDTFTFCIREASILWSFPGCWQLLCNNRRRCCLLALAFSRHVWASSCQTVCDVQGSLDMTTLKFRLLLNVLNIYSLCMYRVYECKHIQLLHGSFYNDITRNVSLVSSTDDAYVLYVMWAERHPEAKPSYYTIAFNPLGPFTFIWYLLISSSINK